MKNKIIVILLATIVLLIGCIAAPTVKDVLADKNKFDDKYLLTYEKTLLDTGETESEKTYQYNSDGLLTESIEHEYFDGYTIKEVNIYTYDDNNRPVIIEKKRINITENEVINVFTFERRYDEFDNCTTESVLGSNGNQYVDNNTYDENGNCILSERTSENSRQETRFSYNNNGDLSNKTVTYYSTSGEYLGEEVFSYDYEYDNGNIVTVDQVYDYTKAPEGTGLFMLIKNHIIYTYDENNNRITETKYTEDVFGSGGETIERDGVKYELYRTTHYTYSLLSEMNATTNIQQTEKETTDIQQTSTENNSESKPLLIAIDYYMSGELYSSVHYNYDLEGRISEYYIENNIGERNSYYDFVYDDEGKMISARQKYGSYTYEYDKKGNCIKTVSTLDSGDTTVYTYIYDEYNNIIKETETWENYVYEKEKKLTYENGKCVQAVTTSVVNGDISEGVEKYEYDENGNIYSVSRYYDFSSGDDETVVVNGEVYYLYDIAYYTYKNETSAGSSDKAQANVQNATTTVAKRLSDDCEKILCTGTNADGDYYEIIANKKEDYNGLVYFVGVIKNNEWLLEPTSNMPFILANGSKVGDVFYLGNNCFISKFSEQKRKNDFSAPYQIYTVYNVENGKTYSTLDWEGANYNVIPLIKSDKDEYMIIGYNKQPNGTEFIVLNKIDMTVSTVEVKGYMKCFSNISENLFCVGIGDSNYPKYYFYDLNGNIVLDLSEYRTEANQSVFFSDGVCSIDIINNNNTEYKLSIDKSGQVIDSYKIN